MSPKHVKLAGSCFIATAAFESTDAPAVIALQSFRDECLLPYVIGRIIVQWYEHISPPLARFIAQRPILRWLTRTTIVLPLAYLASFKVKNH
jgi:hypothetical protein